LPNLSSIKVAGDNLDLLVEGGVGPEQELLVQAMKSALERITSLKIGSARPSSVAHALSHVDKRRLQRLVFHHAESIMPLEDELVAVLKSLDGLVDVKLDASQPIYVAEMQRRLRLYHVRTLKFMCSGEGHTPEYSNGLLLAHLIAPSLEVLSIDDLNYMYKTFRLVELPHPLLPNLRVFRIDVNESPDLATLHLGNLSALEHLHISSMSSCGDVFPDKDDLASLPSTLRTITVNHTLTLRPSPSRSLLAACDQVGIRLFVRWRAPTLDYARMWCEDAVPSLGQASMDSTEDEVVDLERLFEWAGARARWLLRVGDGRALGELAGAALRLRERFVIEHS